MRFDDTPLNQAANAKRLVGYRHGFRQISAGRQTKSHMRSVHCDFVRRFGDLLCLQQRAGIERKLNPLLTLRTFRNRSRTCSQDELPDPQQATITFANCQVGQFIAAYSRIRRAQQGQRPVEFMLLPAGFPYIENFL